MLIEWDDKIYFILNKKPLTFQQNQGLQGFFVIYLTKSCGVHRPILEPLFGGFGEVGECFEVNFKYLTKER